MAKIKSIPADKVATLIKDLEEWNFKLEMESEPWVSVGYSKAKIKTVIKQLKGEFPII